MENPWVVLVPVVIFSLVYFTVGFFFAVFHHSRRYRKCRMRLAYKFRLLRIDIRIRIRVFIGIQIFRKCTNCDKFFALKKIGEVEGGDGHLHGPPGNRHMTWYITVYRIDKCRYCGKTAHTPWKEKKFTEKTDEWGFPTSE